MLRNKVKCFFLLFTILFVFINAWTAIAQPVGYPKKPISLYIPFKAGGGSDVLGRIIVSLDYDYFKTNMVPVIKPGASGSIATDYVYHSKPDGYTLLLGAPHMVTLLPHVKKVNYDPLKLTYICKINESNSIAITPKNRPWSTWDEFVSYVRKNPGKYSYASTGTWGITHVRIAAILKKLGLKMVHIPYGGGAAANQAVIRGEVDLATSSPSYTIPIIKSGEVKAMATLKYKIKSLPDVPSFKDLGVKAAFPIWRGIIGPPGLPKEISVYLQEQFSKLVKDKSFKSTMKKLGEDIDFVSGDEWYEQIKVQYDEYGEVIKSIANEEKKK